MIKGALVWQLPVEDTEKYIPSNAKYHCFDEKDSLCGKYHQDTDNFEIGIESGEILTNPHFACKFCFKRWKILFSL